MSLAWGFAGGVGKGLYDVTDKRIKDNMEERRDLRRQEIQMDLERFKAGQRRAERAEERSYLKEQTADERSYLEKEGETDHVRALELQRLKGDQAMKLQGAKGVSKDGMAFKPVTLEGETGQELYSFDPTTGKYAPHMPGGGGAVSQEEIDDAVDKWANAKLSWLDSDEDRKEVAVEIGYKGNNLSKENLRYEYEKSLKRQQDVSSPQEISGPGASEPPGMKKTTVGEAMKGGEAAKKDKTEKGVKVTDKDKTEAYEARQSREKLRAFMGRRGKTEAEIKEAEQDIFGDEKEPGQEKASAGMFTGIGAEQPVKQGTPKRAQHEKDAPAQFAKFASLPEKQKYAVFRIYSPYWTAKQRQEAKKMMPKMAKPKASSSYMGL